MGVENRASAEEVACYRALLQVALESTGEDAESAAGMAAAYFGDLGDGDPRSAMHDPLEVAFDLLGLDPDAPEAAEAWRRYKAVEAGIRRDHAAREAPTAEDRPSPAPPTVSGLIASLRRMNEEIRCDGERTAAHTYPSQVRFVDQEGNAYRLVEMEPEMHLNCGCWTGILFRLEREPD